MIDEHTPDGDLCRRCHGTGNEFEADLAGIERGYMRYVRTNKPCKNCRGRGRLDDLCPECKGTGIIISTTFETEGQEFYPQVWCDNCDGTGRLPRCGICGELLQHVRPGKWQCNGEHDV